MLSSIIIGGDADLVRYLRQVCAEFSDICIYKILSDSARRYEIVAVLNAFVPDVVFLDVSDLESPTSLASACLQELLPQRSGTAVVPFSKQPRILTSQDDPALAVGPTLTVPFNADQLDLAIREALRRSRPTSKVSKVVAVLPAKPGAGATTVALHIAGAAASTFRQKTLLIEADLEAGAIAYMLNLHPTNFVGEAISNHMLAENHWDRIVTQSHGIDILPACASPQAARGSRWDFFRLLKFAREQYEVVVVDLPASIDDIAESIIAEADKVVLVSTPEIPSLSMVRRRLWEMETRGVRQRHMHMLVNRHAPGDPEPREMAGIAQREVTSLLPEDACAVKSAGRCNGLLNAKSVLARSIVSLAGDLLEREPPAPPVSPFAFFRKIMSHAFGNFSHGSFEPSTHNPLEASSDYDYSSGRRQLDHL